MSHIFDEYAPVKAEIPGRRNGVLISSEKGEAVAYAFGNCKSVAECLSILVRNSYQGMVIGIHSRDNDLSS